MKKIFLVVIIVIISIACFCLGYLFNEKKTSELIISENNTNKQIQQSESKESIENVSDNKIDSEYKHPIDIEEEKCIEKTHPYMYSNCAKQSEQLWDKEINNQLKVLKQTMNENEYKIVTNSQEKWNEAFLSDEIMINKFISSRQGTINETLGFSSISDIKKQRALLLKNIYDNYKEESEIQKYQ